MYSPDARMMGVRAYLRLKSLRKTASILGVSKSTVHRWVGGNPLSRRARDARKATQAAVRRILDVLEANPFETPRTISETIRTELGVSLGTSTVRFWMKRNGLSRKKACRLVSNDRILELRKEYSTNMAYLYDPDRVVSIDESSFYFDMKPARGYCNKSRRLVVPARPGGRTRWSLLMAVSNNSVVGWKLVKGSINAELFASFVETLDTDQRDIRLMDNASIHKTRHVQDTIVSRGMTPCYLPPYTPDFQPIEHCFSVLKNRFRMAPSCEASLQDSNDANMQERISLAVKAITSSILSHQFEACWKRTELFRE
jgi:transposase